MITTSVSSVLIRVRTVSQRRAIIASFTQVLIAACELLIGFTRLKVLLSRKRSSWSLSGRWSLLLLLVMVHWLALSEVASIRRALRVTVQRGPCVLYLVVQSIHAIVGAVVALSLWALCRSTPLVANLLRLLFVVFLVLLIHNSA